MFEYIEQYLTHYVRDIGVEDKNKQILESIERQCAKGTALTDRQYNLCKTILSSVFPEMPTDILSKQPLRTIDRSKYIKIVDTEDVYSNMVYESSKSDWKWIKVRFPFSKKDIMKINSIQFKHKEYVHRKGSHEHFYRLNEDMIFQVIKLFKDTSFEIDQELLDYYNQICYVLSNEFEYKTCYNNQLFSNIKDDSKSLIEKELGKEYTGLHLLDRKRRYGLDFVEYNISSSLPAVIASREDIKCLVKPSQYTIQNLAESILHLNRFPILVLIDDNEEYNQVYNVYNAFKYFISDEKQCVLFRTDNKDDSENINTFVKDNRLNNWVDNTTEIVYIKKNKLPKLLLRTKWMPMCVLSLSSIPTTKHVKKYIVNSDLFIYYDEEIPLTERYARWQHVNLS